MREVAKKVWNQLGLLEAAYGEAKVMKLTGEQNIDEELGLMDTQIKKMKQERDERRQKLVQEKYSVQTSRLSMGEFTLTRILNSDAESRTIWLLGRFRRDPTENQAILILRKTEFQEDKMHEIFPVMQ